MAESFWSSDVRVSMPIPPEQAAHVPMFGFTFTDGGIAHDITDADYDRLSTPDFHPQGGVQETVWDDQDVDGPFASEETF